METTDQEIETYIKDAMDHQHFSKYAIALTGESENSDGFASHINFATVSATTEEGIEKTIEVVVKSSRKNLIQANPSLYGREAYIYETILPAFTKFQMQNDIKDIFDSVPKCYKTMSDDTMEVLVMENLKKNGYDLYDRKRPLDLNHLKLILREYGKFHAISFAFRDKDRSGFEKLVTNFDDVMIQYFVESLRKTINGYMAKACDIVKEVGDKKLYETCYKVLQKGADVAAIEIMKIVEPESAMLHGDGWNNNFVYKYEGSKVPSKVAILDWQLARLHSPALDISYLIYATCSEEELKHFDELLETYYSSFSTFLTELGSDPEKLFPYSTLQKHWKKYSLFGVLTLVAYLHLILCDDEEVPDFDECDDQADYTEKLMAIKITEESEYRKRLIAAISHYCSYIDS
ncbi:uncharacterized protein LOC108904810 [Anoplophora glabripennis]|uniref:uncharacterized protein LOC108904810 n=1 Tax=Anoplophora glabripennis TaxID=217634 RepID=UPI00087495D6|nr:uncharacterized protein LOC108904810 [Anoplophora glabripennis]XP_018563004.1 uncharacterized protein LOC108904810 [Anoplophora glabripennis]